MKVKPIGNRILIELLKIEEKTFSGIILPKTGETNSSSVGIVVAIGDITEKIELGDKVFFKPHSGIKIPDSNKNLIILKIEEVLAILD